MNDIQRRYLQLEDTEMRLVDVGKGPQLVGYPLVYGKRSVDLGGFVEIIQAGAFDESARADDVRALFNHDRNLVLGRNISGTLHLESDQKGLRMTVDLSQETSVARDVRDHVRRGDVSGGSFSFRVAPGGAVWAAEETADGGEILVRTVIKGRLFDVGPVTFPAYPDTEMSARAADLNLESVLEEMAAFKASRATAATARERELRMRA